MKTSAPLLAVIPILLLAGCRIAVERERAERPTAPAVERAEEPRKTAAILLSESNLEYARTASFTGGPETYTSLLNALRDALAGRGVSADFISEEDLFRDRLRRYCVLYIVDTFNISAASEEAIRRFVAMGGVLVGMNEVGRVQGGSWANPWHYEDIFGVRAIACDQYGTALSADQSMFREADLIPAAAEHDLTRDLGPEKLLFGDRSCEIWATAPSGATVLARFPSYVRTERNDPSDQSVVDEPAIALSVHDFGKGRAVWFAPNVHARKPDAWAAAGDTLEILARCAALARPDIVIPPKPPVVIVAVSQIGYLPDDPKRVIVRVPQCESTPFERGRFRIMTADGKAAAEGVLKAEGPGNPWRDFYFIGDFSQLDAPGEYRVAVELEGGTGSHSETAGPFRVAADLWTATVVPTQYSFLRNYRCGATCHTNDPVRGGYHDATGDYAVRMWSMPHVAYGIAEHILASPSAGKEAADELHWTVAWLMKMLNSSGQVNLSVKPTDDWSPLDKRPAVDPTRRILETGRNLNYQTTYVVGMAHAARAMRKIGMEGADAVLRAATTAYERLVPLDWANTATGDTGNYLWGAVELHLATGNTRYLDEARRVAPMVLKRQWLETGKADGDLRGDFLEGPGKRTFGDRQYKKFHAFGVYYGLIELAALLPESDPLRAQIVSALNTYFTEHVLRGAALTPYGQMITALEPRGDGSFRIFFFTHGKSWVRLHGLNCDHLGVALAALKFNDLAPQPGLREFARAQAHWVAGFNPLGYCMIDFMGWRNGPPIPDDQGTGRFAGGIPNGIVGDAGDRPAWGVIWDSREYWLPHNAYLLALAPHLERR